MMRERKPENADSRSPEARLRQIRVAQLAALVVLTAAALLAYRLLNPPAEAVNETALSVEASSSDVAAVAPSTSAWRRDAQGCLVPGRSTPQAQSLETGATPGWQLPGGGGDRLQRDPCGQIWALWFNSWNVYAPGPPALFGKIELPDQPAVRDIKRAGVGSFAFAADGALWLLGRNGGVARLQHLQWQALPELPGCHAGELQRFRHEIWVACGGHPLSVARWNEAGQRWDSIGGAPGNALRLTVDREQRLWAAGAGTLARRDAGLANGWFRVDSPHPEPSRLTALPGRLAIGSEQGLWLFDGEGTPQGQALPGQPITGIADADNGGLWVAVQGQGLHHHDGQRWRSWRFAHGLPDDTARDLIDDGAGRLWLAGTPLASIDAKAAQAQVMALPEPKSLPGQRFADACSAADHLLADVAQSGQLSQVQFGEQRLVFLAGQQICPDPHQQDDNSARFWRRADGHLLEMAYNGSRQWRSCGQPCSDEQREALAPFWQVQRHRPEGEGWQSERLPLPQPIPEQAPGDLFLLGSNDQIWLATRGTGVFQFDGQRWRRHGAEAGFIPGSPPQALLDDGSGTIWVGNSPQWLPAEQRRAGPALQRWQDGRWHPWQDDSHVINSVFALAANAGNVWIGDNGRLLRIGPEGIQSIDDDTLRKRGLVLGLSLDAQGWPWFAHGVFGEGLSHYDGQRVRYLTSREGLFADRLRQIGHDGETRVWLIADDGRVQVYERTVLLDAMQP